MSAFASLALSTKPSFQPLLAFIANGLRLFVGPNTAEGPDVASTRPGADSRVPDATKTIPEPSNASLLFPLIMGLILASVALCLVILSLKGVAGGSAHSVDGFKAGRGGPADNQPEPNDSPPGNTSIREVNGTQRTNGEITNDGEPPPPPPTGTTNEAAHRLPNWWIRFLLWLFRLLRRTLRLFWAWRWTAIPSAVAYLFGDKLFWSFITARWAQTGIAYTLQLMPTNFVGFSNHPGEYGMTGVRLGIAFTVVAPAMLVGNPISGALLGPTGDFTWAPTLVFNGVQVAAGATFILIARIPYIRRKCAGQFV